MKKLFSSAPCLHRVSVFILYVCKSQPAAHMKLQLFYISIACMAFTMSCNNKKETALNNTDTIAAVDSVDRTDTIRQKIPDSVAVNENKPVNRKYEEIVRGQAFYRLSYCGGARPTPEIEAEFRKEYPLTNQKIKFVQLQHPDQILEIRTDGSGHFSAGLAPGTWNYYLMQTPGSKIPPNPNCNKYFSRSYGSFTVKAGDASTQKVLYPIPCDPCSPPRP